MQVLKSSALHRLNQAAFVVLRSGQLTDHGRFLVEIDWTNGLWNCCMMDGRRFLYLLTASTENILEKAPERPLLC